MIELAIIFMILVVLLGIGFSMLHLSNNHSVTAPDRSSSTFADTHFTPTQMYLDHASGTGIAINEAAQTICIIQSATQPPHFVHFTELAASFILRNGEVIHATLRTHPQEYAALANDLQDQLSTKSESKLSTSTENTRNQKIELCLTMLGQESSIQTINFLDMETKEEGIMFTKAMASTKHWHHLLSDLIQQANGVKASSESAQPPHRQAQDQDSAALIAD
ncbi:MAG: hypothetical protein NPIRA04_07050 [Nitrospirales bacterium]|nr:MAG: hypothetical protein NPIRA04_07050 [Nitrospirales bacterium]